MNSATIAVRTSPEVKEDAKAIFAQLGIDMSAAINLFLKQAIVDRGLPFKPSLKDLDNAEARYEAEHGIGKEFDNLEDLFKDLHSDD